MKIAVSVHGRFHAFDLASGLHRRGLLSCLLTTYPAAVARAFVSRDIPLSTAPLIEIGRRLSEWTGIGGGAPVWTARRFARFAARQTPADIDLFVGWSGASLEALRAMKKRGVATVLERGSTHISHQRDVLAQTSNRWGHAARLPEPAMVERELAEYEVADAIMVPTPLAAETFIERGVTATKIHVNPYGIDLLRWPPPERDQRQGPTRILFVGSVGARKGVPVLLEAFAALKENCELHLVGPVEPELRPALRGTLPPRVAVHGPLRGAELARVFESADVFCLPSVEEGLALVLLQAMAMGLPIVATPATGVGAIGAEQEGAIVVSQNEAGSLAEALDRLSRNPDWRLELGRRARRRVEAEFTVDRYVDRAVAAYRGILSTRSGAAASNPGQGSARATRK